MKTFGHLYTRIFDTPLAIQQSKLDTILGVIGDRLGLEATAEQIEAAAKAFKSQKQNYGVQDGIALIDIFGSLMKKTSGLMAESGCTSYADIGSQFQDAMKNPNIKGVLMNIDSPGGETSGLFELADMLSAYKGTKPVFAIANDGAFSAAYALASCADQIYLTRTAGVGSIGVICCHVDQSGADEKKGLKYTMIHAGSKKADGNSHEPLSESALSDTQAEVNRQYQMFASLVAKNRNVSVDAIKATEAGVCFAENAIPLLADCVGTFEDALAALCARCDMSAALNTSVKSMPAIPPHKTATVKTAWNGPQAKKNLKANQKQAYYTKAFAFRDADADPTTKAGYSFIHHEVNASGAIGAANLTACSSGIAVLNGGRGADLSKYSGADIKGIYAHLAGHLKDAGQEPPALTALDEDFNELMAKTTEQSIDELVAQAAAKSTDEYMDDAEDAQDEADDAKDMAKEKQDDADDEADEAEDAKENDSEDDDDEDDEDDKKATKADFVRIVNLCAIAKLPALAAEFINANYTVAQVEKALLKHRASKTKKVKIASANAKPANDFATVAEQIRNDKTISNKAAAFRKHLVKNADAYVQFRKQEGGY